MTESPGFGNIQLSPTESLCLLPNGSTSDGLQNFPGYVTSDLNEYLSHSQFLQDFVSTSNFSQDGSTNQLFTPEIGIVTESSSIVLPNHCKGVDGVGSFLTSASDVSTPNNNNNKHIVKETYTILNSTQISALEGGSEQNTDKQNQQKNKDKMDGFFTQLLSEVVDIENGKTLSLNQIDVPCVMSADQKPEDPLESMLQGTAACVVDNVGQVNTLEPIQNLINNFLADDVCAVSEVVTTEHLDSYLSQKEMDAVDDVDGVEVVYLNDDQISELRIYDNIVFVDEDSVMEEARKINKQDVTCSETFSDLHLLSNNSIEGVQTEGAEIQDCRNGSWNTKFKHNQNSELSDKGKVVISQNTLKKLIGMLAKTPAHTKDGKTCSKGETLRCGYCQLEFPTRKVLIAHLKKFHSGNTCQNICGFCNEAFKTQHLLQDHILLMHKMNMNSKVCMVCGERFNKITALRRHEKLHNDTKSYQCSLCGLLFRGAQGLVLHLSTYHTKRDSHKEFSCLICNRSFSNKDRFAKHVHIHATERTNWNNSTLDAHRIKQTACANELQSDTISSSTEELLHANLSEPHKFQCLLCAEGFVDEVGALNHLSASHSTETSLSDTASDNHTKVTVPTFVPITEAVTNSELSLLKYGPTPRSISRSSGDIHELFCAICNVGFMSRSKAQSHINYHFSEINDHKNDSTLNLPYNSQDPHFSASGSHLTCIFCSSQLPKENFSQHISQHLATLVDMPEAEGGTPSVKCHPGITIEIQSSDCGDRNECAYDKQNNPVISINKSNNDLNNNVTRVGPNDQEILKTDPFNEMLHQSDDISAKIDDLQNSDINLSDGTTGNVNSGLDGEIDQPLTDGEDVFNLLLLQQTAEKLERSLKLDENNDTDKLTDNSSSLQFNQVRNSTKHDIIEWNWTTEQNDVEMTDMEVENKNSMDSENLLLFGEAISRLESTRGDIAEGHKSPEVLKTKSVIDSDNRKEQLDFNASTEADISEGYKSPEVLQSKSVLDSYDRKERLDFNASSKGDVSEGYKSPEVLQSKSVIDSYDRKERLDFNASSKGDVSEGYKSPEVLQSKSVIDSYDRKEQLHFNASTNESKKKLNESTLSESLKGTSFNLKIGSEERESNTNSRRMENDDNRSFKCQLIGNGESNEKSDGGHSSLKIKFVLSRSGNQEPAVEEKGSDALLYHGLHIKKEDWKKMVKSCCVVVERCVLKELSLHSAVDTVEKTVEQKDLREHDVLKTKSEHPLANEICVSSVFQKGKDDQTSDNIRSNDGTLLCDFGTYDDSVTSDNSNFEYGCSIVSNVPVSDATIVKKRKKKKSSTNLSNIVKTDHLKMKSLHYKNSKRGISNDYDFLGKYKKNLSTSFKIPKLTYKSPSKMENVDYILKHIRAESRTHNRFSSDCPTNTPSPDDFGAESELNCSQEKALQSRLGTDSDIDFTITNQNVNGNLEANVAAAEMAQSDDQIKNHDRIEQIKSPKIQLFNGGSFLANLNNAYLKSKKSSKVLKSIRLAPKCSVKKQEFDKHESFSETSSNYRTSSRPIHPGDDKSSKTNEMLHNETLTANVLLNEKSVCIQRKDDIPKDVNKHDEFNEHFVEVKTNKPILENNDFNEETKKTHTSRSKAVDKNFGDTGFSTIPACNADECHSENTTTTSTDNSNNVSVTPPVTDEVDINKNIPAKLVECRSEELHEHYSNKDEMNEQYGCIEIDNKTEKAGCHSESTTTTSADNSNNASMTPPVTDKVDITENILAALHKCQSEEVHEHNSNKDEMNEQYGCIEIDNKTEKAGNMEVEDPIVVGETSIAGYSKRKSQRRRGRKPISEKSDFNEESKNLNISRSKAVNKNFGDTGFSTIPACNADECHSESTTTTSTDNSNNASMTPPVTYEVDITENILATLHKCQSEEVHEHYSNKDEMNEQYGCIEIDNKTEKAGNMEVEDPIVVGETSIAGHSKRKSQRRRGKKPISEKSDFNEETKNLNISRSKAVNKNFGETDFSIVPACNADECHSESTTTTSADNSNNVSMTPPVTNEVDITKNTPATLVECRSEEEHSRYSNKDEMNGQYGCIEIDKKTEKAGNMEVEDPIVVGETSIAGYSKRKSQRRRGRKPISENSDFNEETKNLNISKSKAVNKKIGDTGFSNISAVSGETKKSNTSKGIDDKYCEDTSFSIVAASIANEGPSKSTVDTTIDDLINLKGNFSAEDKVATAEELPGKSSNGATDEMYENGASDEHQVSIEISRVKKENGIPKDVNIECSKDLKVIEGTCLKACKLRKPGRAKNGKKIPESEVGIRVATISSGIRLEEAESTLSSKEKVVSDLIVHQNTDLGTRSVDVTGSKGQDSKRDILQTSRYKCFVRLDDIYSSQKDFFITCDGEVSLRTPKQCEVHSFQKNHSNIENTKRNGKRKRSPSQGTGKEVMAKHRKTQVFRNACCK